MSASVFAFPSRVKGPQPWTNDELAELYRVVDLLGRAGLSVTTDMGMSDEGDPWFVFCRVDNDEVIAHFARIDGIFVAASIAVDETFRGANFRQIVDRMVSSQPLVMPRPDSGSKLFLHPAVMLTAFVATALAHSEKTHALDWLRVVEAQWDHSKASILAEVRHLKTGWLDTLQTILKMPLHEYKLAVDSSKETQALTLVSLIAIAMSALQPIVEKISVIAQFVADELPGHVSAAQGQSAHAAQMVLDGANGDGIGQAGYASDSSNTHATADDAPQTHKFTAATASSDPASDGQKALIDAAHAAASVATVQKVALYDESAHAQAAPIEVQPEAVGAFLMAQQKIVAMAAAPQVESIVILPESANITPTVIGTEDVTPLARQVLSINGKADVSSTPDVSATSPAPSAGEPAHSPAADSSGADPSGAAPSAPDNAAPVASAPATSVVNSAAQPAAAVVIPQNQVVDDVNTPFATVIQTISSFVNSGHFANDSAVSTLTGNTVLQNELASFFTAGTSSLKVVFFDSNTTEPSVFLFSPGVVFVDEKVIAPSLHVTNGGGTLTLDVDTQGGAVTLVGVATVTEHTVVSV